MSTAAPLQTKAAKAQPQGSSTHAGLLLQRKCACGSPTSSLTGECAECKSKKRLQTKLTIGASNDPLEQEADRVADQVLAAPANRAVSGAPPHIQRFTGQATGQTEAAPASVDQALAIPGRPLEPALRQDMEQRFSYDFSRVRVHSGTVAEQSAQDIDARAYTVGRDVVFGAGQYAPASTAGKKLIAHELAHVTQQAQNAFPPAPKGQALLQRSPRSKKAGSRREKERMRTIDSKTARLVMQRIVAIVSKLEQTDPAEMRADDKSLSEYRDLLSLWFKLANGKLEGEAFASAFERADAETTPILETSLRGADTSWQKVVWDRWLPDFYELESSADSEKRIAKRVETTTSFTHASSKEPISFDEFLRVASANNTRSPVLQRGSSGIKVGRAVAGFTYYASQNEPRLVLWASSDGVFFLFDDQIYKQSIAGFSDDIILGALIKAAQDVAPFVNLITAVVDIALSLMPVGAVYDLTMAGKAIAEGNWGDAALELLPGPALNKATKLAKETRIGSAAFRGGAKGAKFLGKAISGTASFVGKGIGKVKEKLTPGLWLVAEGAGEAGGKKAYYFLDEAEDVWRAVPEEEAWEFIKCSKCQLTPDGKELGAGAEAKSAEVLEEFGEAGKKGTRKTEEELIELGGYQHAFEGPLGDIVSNPVEAGNLFNKVNVPKGAHAEVQLRTPSGRRPRVDLYVNGEAIISRKFPTGQLAEDELKALEYLQELYIKYPPKAPIRSSVLKGEVLQGIQVLQIPVQHLPIPERVLKYTKDRRIFIVDITAKVYNQ